MTQSDNTQANATRSTVWAIGGADSLGVAADIRAAVANHVQCATIVSSVSKQTGEQLSATSIEMLKAQWKLIGAESQANVFKIGLLVNQEQVEWLAHKLSNYRQQHPELTVIYQPEWLNSGQQSLVATQMMAAVKQQLLPLVDLLIVNAGDAQCLTEQILSQPQDAIELGRLISQQYSLSVLINIDDQPRSLTYDCFLASARHSSIPLQGGFVMATPYKGPDILPAKTCTLSSLIASLIANDYILPDALILAKAIMGQAIFKPHPLGNDRDDVFQLSPVSGFNDLPEIFSFSQFCDQFIAQVGSAERTAFAPCEANLGLYPVVDSIDWLEKLLKLGVKTIQLRCKDLNEVEAEPHVFAAIALGRQYQARVFINDYWRLAVKHQAYGVHLGQEDLAIAELELIKSSGLRLGVSTHNVVEALIALKLKPSYIALGHIFETQTKEMPSQPQGLAKLALQVQLFNHRCPLVAIGGISAKRVTAVKATAVGAIALVSAITKADDYQAVTTALLAEVGRGDPITNSERVFATTDNTEALNYG